MERGSLISRAVFTGVLVGFFLSVSHAEVTLDGTLGPSGPISGPDYLISDDLGQLKGSNLFHSFGIFNVNTGESATFTGPNNVENILGRVTGGNASFIDGRLSSQIPGANLFLMNPSGLMFGPNATLDLSGSFHATTADYIGLADGGRFDAATPSHSVLTAAPPEAFGFLSGNPAAISIDNSALEVPKGETVSLIGGDIEIVGDSNKTSVSAPAGQINIASVASSGEVLPNAVNENADLQMNGFVQLGEVRLSEGAELNTGGDGGGTVVIRGGRFIVDNSYVNASSKGSTDGSPVEDPGEGIDIEVTGSVELTNGSQLNTNVFSGVTQDSGGIRITADSLKVLGDRSERNSSINSVVLKDGMGNSGNIEIEARSVTVRDEGFIRVNTAGSGDSGNIIIRTDLLNVIDGGSIFTLVFNGGSGDAGDIEVEAGDVRLSTTAPDLFTIISSQSLEDSTGAAGDVRITAHGLQLLPWTAISSVTFDAGLGGSVEVVADNVQITGVKERSGTSTGLFTNTFGSGKGGDLRVTANTVALTDRASLQTLALGTEDGGKITISTSDLQLREGSFIISSARRAGIANAGDIEISAQNLSINGFASASAPFSRDATGIFSEGKEGNAGDIRISATESVHLNNRASISASSSGAGQGGEIEITSQSFQLLNGSNILSSTFGLGNGGLIKIKADELIISGVHPEPFVSESLAPSGIASQSDINGGNAGTIKLNVRKLEVLDGAKVSTETFGPGNGGSIELDTDQLIVAGENAVQRKFLIDKGIDPVGARSTISTSSQSDVLGSGTTGNAGIIQIRTGGFVLSNKGLIDSSTTGPGLGGTVEIKADNMRLVGEAGIQARSRSLVPEAGDAGNIRITVSDTFESKNSIVLAQADEADGGNIEVKAKKLVYLQDNSAITASVGGGTGNGGNITIDPEFVILNQSRITANAFGGTGGNIRIVADQFLASPDSAVTASSELGIDGEVVINAPATDVISGIEAVPAPFLDVSSLLSSHCAARTEATVGSFVKLGRGGVPPAPDSLRPSYYLDVIANTQSPKKGRIPAKKFGRFEPGNGSRIISENIKRTRLPLMRLADSCGGRDEY
jgi:filamentous hemagglutinin family protein